MAPDSSDDCAAEWLILIRGVVDLHLLRGYIHFNYADLARSLAIPQSTLKRYMALLETTFVVRRLPAWSANLGSRRAPANTRLPANCRTVPCWNGRIRAFGRHGRLMDVCYLPKPAATFQFTL